MCGGNVLQTLMRPVGRSWEKLTMFVKLLGISVLSLSSALVLTGLSPNAATTTATNVAGCPCPVCDCDADCDCVETGFCDCGNGCCADGCCAENANEFAAATLTATPVSPACCAEKAACCEDEAVCCEAKANFVDCPGCAGAACQAAGCSEAVCCEGDCGVEACGCEAGCCEAGCC